MPAYFAMRVEIKYNENGFEVAKTYYDQVFSIQTYLKFKADTDAILIVDGYGDVVTL